MVKAKGLYVAAIE